MRLISCACLLLMSTNAWAAEITRTGIDVNTVGNVSLTVVFEFDVGVAREKSDDLQQSPAWALRDDQGRELHASTSVGFSRKAVRFVVDRPNPELFQALFDATRVVHLKLKQPVRVILEDGGEFLLTSEVAQALTRRMGPTTGRQRELIEKHRLGAYLLSKDVFDIAREVDPEDTTRAEYVVSFRFLRPVYRNAPVLWRAEGRVGTQAGEPLNAVEFALSSQAPILAMAKLPTRGFLEASYLGDQRFRRTTFNTSAGVEAIAPNLLDLTGNAGRVRPRPVVTLGVSYARRPNEQALFGDEKSSWEWFGSAEYYVPVATKLALSYSGKIRYSDNIVGSDKVRTTNAVSLSYDLPLEDLKALVKWEAGQHPLVTEERRRLLAGFLLDRLPF